MTLSAIIIGIEPEEINFTLKSFSGTRNYIDEIIIVHSCQEFNLENIFSNNDNYPKIRLLRTEKLGICAAFNHGLHKATSEYIVYVNSGDELILKGLISATNMLAKSPSVVSSAVSIYSPITDSTSLWTGLDSKSQIIQIHRQGTIYKKHYMRFTEHIHPYLNAQWIPHFSAQFFHQN